MRNSETDAANNVMAASPTEEGSMSMGILALVAGGLVVALLVVMAVLLFRPND